MACRWGLKSGKSPYVRMAMLAPGTAPSRGTADFKKALVTFHAQVLGLPSRERSYAVVHEIDPEAFGYAEDPVSVRNFLENVGQQPFAVFDDPLPMARGAKVAALARKRQKIFVAAMVASDPGEAASQVAAVRIAIDHIRYICRKPFRAQTAIANKRKERSRFWIGLIVSQCKCKWKP